MSQSDIYINTVDKIIGDGVLLGFDISPFLNMEIGKEIKSIEKDRDAEREIY